MIPATSDVADWEHVVLDSEELSMLRKKHFRKTNYQAQYVEMSDGVRIAVDVLLPGNTSDQKFPACVTQCRYMRGVGVRWPFSILTNGLPLDLLHSEITMRLVDAGFAVVLYDIRGTGASSGAWKSLWGPDEQNDSVEILDWIVKQSWSSGKVVLSGASYEAGAALFTLARNHPSVQCAVLLYPFWDLYTDISCPGGVPHKRFVQNWDSVCKNLDANRISALGKILQIPFLGTQPVIEENWPQTSVLTSSYWSGAWKYWQARSEAFKTLQRNVSEHQNFSALKAMETTRFVDQVDSQSNLPIWQASQCHKAEEITKSGTKMLIVSGWLDQTANAAIQIFQHTSAPGSRLVIGPWSHAGYLNNSVGHQKNGKRSQFGGSQRVVQFIKSSLEDDSDVKESSDKVHPVSYYTMGYQCGWKQSEIWPPKDFEQTEHCLYLSGTQRLDLNPSCMAETMEQVIREGNHPEGHSRYDLMTNMAVPMSYKNLDSCGHLLFTTKPLMQPYEITGWVTIKLWISSNAKDVDIFCYLESLDPKSGSIEYITEGCFRASHRKIQTNAISEDPRYKAIPNGEFSRHSYTQEDTEPLVPGEPVQCHFTLLPTSFCFTKGHCIRLAISGSDTKHFFSDLPCDGSRLLKIHTGGITESQILFPASAKPCFES